MGKPTGKKKLEAGVEKVTKQNKAERSSKQIDEDTAVFIQMSQELKEEGNKLFQKRDNEGAMLKYEKAVKLLPANHIDVASLRSNMAACYMQIGIGEYPRAIHECNLALEVAPKYSKALLKRARCYEALNKFEWALRDVRNVLNMEPNNITALEIEDLVKKSIEEKGLKIEEIEAVLPPDYINPSPSKAVKTRKRKSNKVEKKTAEEKVKVETEQVKENKVEEVKDKKVQKVNHNKNRRVNNKRNDKKVEDIEDKNSIKEEKIVTKTVKLVLNDDIRFAQLPIGCSIGLVREIVWDRFPNLEGVLIKYKDEEGDLITITTTAELRLAENSSDPQGSLRLYLVETSPDKEPSYEGFSFTSNSFPKANSLISSVSENGNVGKISQVTTCVEDWVVQFAKLFKDHVGFDSNPSLDLHELGMELYSEAIEETVTTENAQKIFDIAGGKFQEMAALGLFNLGNVHMNKARKWAEDGTKEGYKYAENEYIKAGTKYEESLKIKPDFFEGFLALGQQQFEQVKLLWCSSAGNKADFESDAAKILELYNKAEDSMEHGMQIWEELEEQRLNGLNLNDKCKDDLVNLGLEGYLKDVSAEEAEEQSAHLKKQMYVMWGTLLYERSVVEFKMNLSAFEESLAASVEKYELAGASPTDLAAIVKNHCSNSEGLGFKVNEIVEAWNDMYDVKGWQTGVPSFRLEPLLRRRVSKQVGSI